MGLVLLVQQFLQVLRQLWLLTGMYLIQVVIAGLVGWVKERNPTMRNDNFIVELQQSLSDEVRTPILLARKY